MGHRRSQVLADGQDVAVHGAQVAEGPRELRALLAQPDHDRALRVGHPTELGGIRLRALEDAQAAVVAGSLADRGLQPLHRLDVVVQDVRTGFHHGPQRRLLAVEVGDQHLHAHRRAAVPESPDRLREDARAAVGQVVAGDRRHDDVLEAHRLDGLRDATWLVGVEPGRPARLDGAEPAGAGARVAEDHHGCRALVPALPEVGAAGLLADRVEVLGAHQAAQVAEAVASRDPGSKPLRVAPRGGGPAIAIAGGRGEDRQLAAHRHPVYGGGRQPPAGRPAVTARRAPVGPTGPRAVSTPVPPGRCSPPSRPRSTA